FGKLDKRTEGSLDRFFRRGRRETVNNRNGNPAIFQPAPRSIFGEGQFNGVRAHRDGRGIFERARHRQHQRGRVAEVAIEFDGPSAGRKAQRIQLQVHVAELCFGIFYRAGKLNLNDREAGQRKRLEAEIAAERRSYIRIFGYAGFDRTSDKLFDLFGGGTGILGDDRSDTNRNVRVLSLGHLLIAVNSQRDGGDQQNPGNLAVFDEEPSGVVLVLDQIFVGSSRHRSLLRLLLKI